MDGYVGEIRAFAFNFVPRGWLPCNGAVYPIQNYTPLFSVIATQFGGNGTTSFAVPDLRGVTLMGTASQIPGFNTPGTKGGSEAVTLTTATMPAHTHTLQAVIRTSQPQTAAAISQPGTDAFLTNGYSITAGKGIVVYSDNSSGIALNAQTIAISGQSTPHDNMDPYLAMTYCICAEGVYPQRQ